MATHQYLVVFSVRRDTWSGELELDGFLCVDAAQLEKENLQYHAVNALEGRVPTVASASPTYRFDRTVQMMKLRAANDGAIAGVYCVKSDTNHTRDTFAPIPEAIGLRDLNNYRI